MNSWPIFISFSFAYLLNGDWGISVILLSIGIVVYLLTEYLLESDNRRFKRLNQGNCTAQQNKEKFIIFNGEEISNQIIFHMVSTISYLMPFLILLVDDPHYLNIVSYSLSTIYFMSIIATGWNTDLINPYYHFKYKNILYIRYNTGYYYGNKCNMVIFSNDKRNIMTNTSMR